MMWVGLFLGYMFWGGHHSPAPAAREVSPVQHAEPPTKTVEEYFQRIKQPYGTSR